MDDIKALLTTVFETARQGGKRDWYRMTSAVLKNRLLQATDRAFDEANYGADSILALVAKHPELVSIDRTTKPTTVVWKEAPTAQPAVEAPAPKRIRTDLWRAVCDYSSGQQYEWDASRGIVRAVEQADPRWRLPTIGKNDLSQLRKAFAATRIDTLEKVEDRTRLNEWVEKQLGTRHLPRELQPLWNSALNDAVTRELEDWFKTHSLPEPEQGPRNALEASGRTTDLRHLIHQCVDLMSPIELRELRLPAHVLLRIAHRD